MSKGPGQVQRAILSLIEGEPDGAWTFEELCRLVYQVPGNAASRAQLSAVGRALARIALPGGWTIASPNRDLRKWLYNGCSLEAARKAHRSYRNHHFEPGGRVFLEVEEARRWRDGSPLERVRMQIEVTKTYMGLLGIGLQNGGDTKSLTTEIRKAVDQIKELEAKRAELQAAFV